MPPLLHSVCSPSSAKRWIHCSPSAVDNAKAERKDTVFTREGTLAHEFCETKARYYLKRDLWQDDFVDKIADLKEDELWQEEMDRYTDMYIDCLRDFIAEFDERPHIVIERKLDFGEYIPDSFGTADCILIGMDTIHVVDFKYGKGVEVSAVQNDQMRVYALGALLAYGDLADFRTVKMSIVQPRISSEPSTWETSVEQLLTWAKLTVMPAAKLALKGQGKHAAGEWCKWCVNDGKCRAQLAEFERLEAYDYQLPPVLSDTEVSNAIALGERLSDWINALKAYALDRCMDGGDIPGFKAVEGRSTRVWTNEKAAFKAAQDIGGIPEEMLYERKPITLTEMEKLLGKKKFAEIMREYVDKPVGRPTLALATDKRDAITKATTAADDFGAEANK